MIGHQIIIQRGARKSMLKLLHVPSQGINRFKARARANMNALAKQEQRDRVLSWQPPALPGTPANSSQGTNNSMWNSGPEGSFWHIWAKRATLFGICRLLCQVPWSSSPGWQDGYDCNSKTEGNICVPWHIKRDCLCPCGIVRWWRNLTQTRVLSWHIWVQDTPIQIGRYCTLFIPSSTWCGKHYSMAQTLILPCYIWGILP